jgi:hypothetical protein
MPANIKKPFPMEEYIFPSIVTLASKTLCITTRIAANISVCLFPQKMLFGRSGGLSLLAFCSVFYFQTSIPVAKELKQTAPSLTQRAIQILKSKVLRFPWAKHAT